MPKKLTTVVNALDRKLRINEFNDASNNGLQVANNGRVGKICCGVDASLEFIEAAASRGADMLICHHGISWGDSLKYITKLNYRRISMLIRHNIALYACHLPLDAHPVLGNNAQICATLELKKRRPFGTYNGIKIGFEGELPHPIPYAQFKDIVKHKLAAEIRSMDFGPDMVRKIGVVSGGAAGETAEAGREQLDVYLTGEPTLEAYSVAQEYGINVIFAGHYATEIFGVRAVAQWVRTALKIPSEFINLNIPY